MPAPIYTTQESWASALPQLGAGLSDAVAIYAKQKNEESLKNEKFRQSTILGDVLKTNQYDLTDSKGIQDLSRDLSLKGVQIEPLEMLKLMQNAQKEKTKPTTPTSLEAKRQSELDKFVTTNEQNAFTSQNLLQRFPEYKQNIENLKDQWPTTKMLKPSALYGADEQAIVTMKKDLLPFTIQLKNMGLLTGQKLKLMEDALPSPEKSYEANMQAMKLAERMLQKNVEVADFIDIETQKNNGVVPSDIKRRLINHFRSQFDDLITDKSDKQQEKEFKTLPSPSENKGKYFKNPSTGKVFYSNGTNWVKK